MGVRFSLRLCLTLPSGPLFTSSGRVWASTRKELQATQWAP